MTVDDWNKLLVPTNPWHETYPIVEAEARRLLTALAVPRGGDRMLTTGLLVERLYPEAAVRGDGHYARQRLFKAFLAMAKTSMADCCCRSTVGRRSRFSSAMTYGWMWHAPADEPHPERKQPKTKDSICPHCGCDTRIPPKVAAQ